MAGRSSARPGTCSRIHRPCSIITTKTYGAVSRISITGNKCLLLLHPDHVQRVLMDREKNFSIKMGWQSVMADFFQGGLVMREYDEHRVHRGIMQSSFKPAAMRA